MKRVSIIILVLFILLGCSFSGTAQTNLEKIFEFPNGEIGYGVVNNKNGILLITRYKGNNDKKIAWYSHNKMTKEIVNVEDGKFSPDGKYYSYIKNDVLYIYNEKNKLINKFPQKSYSGGITWSRDSKYIFIDSEQLHKFDINTGTDEIILIPKKSFHPVTVNNPNVLYLLKPNFPSADSDSDIIKYDLITKKFLLLKLPDNLSTFGYFTISPDEKIVILQCYGLLNVVDLTKNEIIDKTETSKSCEAFGYSWQNDSSSLTFTMTGREIYKYTIPSMPSILLSLKLEKILTSEYAKNIQQNPGGKELSQTDQQEQITKANSLSDEGFTYYKEHNNIAAVAKYKEALTHYATAEIYYRLGNSLSNISRLQEAIKAYQIAVELNHDKSHLVYFIACAYSRLNYSKPAFDNLELAIKNGYKKFDHIQKDDDLAFLRSLPQWNDWWAKYKK